MKEAGSDGAERWRSKKCGTRKLMQAVVVASVEEQARMFTARKAIAIDQVLAWAAAEVESSFSTQRGRCKDFRAQAPPF